MFEDIDGSYRAKHFEFMNLKCIPMIDDYMDSEYIRRKIGYDLESIKEGVFQEKIRSMFQVSLGLLGA